MLTHLRTILIVSLISVLVWVFAESETLRQERTTITLTLSPNANAETQPTKLISRAGDSALSIPIAVTFEGASGKLEGITSAIKGTVTLAPGDTGVPSLPGEHTIVLDQALTANNTLVQHGVRVVSAEPRTLQVRVENAATVQVPVEVVGEDGTPFPGAMVSPSTIALSVPDSLRARLESPADGTTPSVRAIVPRAELDRLVPGRAEMITGVPLSLPAPLRDLGVSRMTPQRVAVTVTLRSRTVEHLLKNVPVHVRLAPDELSRWDIRIPEEDRALTDVKVSGPPDLIQQIKDRAIPVIAVVPLSFEELERGITSKDAVFADVPTSLRFEAAKTTVRLVITRKPQPTPERSGPPIPGGN